MSRVIGLGVLAALWLSWSPGTGAAQQTEDQLLQRLDSLRPLLEAAAEELEVFNRERQERYRIEAAAQAEVDTLRVGMMTIVTPVGQAETARELFSEVWAERYANVVSSPGLETSVFSFQWADDAVRIHIERNLREIRLSRWVRRSRVKDQIRHAIGVSIAYDLSAAATEIGDWVAGDPHRDHDLAEVYRQLATTQSVATRGCVDGDVDSCSLLGNIPLIGTILVGEEGSGIFAGAYTVTGPRDNPRVTVNPLTALLPGVLRKIMTGAGGRPSAQDPVYPYDDEKPILTK